MSLLRTLPLLATVALLAACASKPATHTQIAPSAIVSAPADQAADFDNNAVATAATGHSAAASSGPVDNADVDQAATPAASNDVSPTDAEDDFAALYGGPAPSLADTTRDGIAATATYDPWESYNRKVHSFNNVVDRAVARPLAYGYVKVIPRFARTGVSNFFTNLRAPVNIANQLLQGRADDAWDTLGRFLMNSTLGIGGVFDPASKALVPRRSEDFGQTLGAWGWRNSRYVELPLFGPRTVRDVIGLAGDMPLSPLRQVELDKLRVGLQGVQLVDTRAQLMAVDDLRDSAVDEYSLTRDAWLQRRSYQIERDLRGDKHRDQEEQTTIPVDAMPMPDWVN